MNIGKSALNDDDRASRLSYSESDDNAFIDSNLLDNLSTSSNDILLSGNSVTNRTHSSHSTKGGKGIEDTLNEDKYDIQNIKPLQFKMSRTIKDEGAERRKSISHENGLGKRIDTASNSNKEFNYQTDKNNTLHALASIDLEQFESYLKKPVFMETFKKSKNIKQFRRLFLAQELRVPNDLDTCHSPTNTNSALSPVPPVTSITSSFQPRSSKAQSAKFNTSKAIWSTKFSHDGKYMAVGTRDCNIVIWSVISSPIERWELDSRSEQIDDLRAKTQRLQQNNTFKHSNSHPFEGELDEINLYGPVFNPIPHTIFREHTQDILSLDWSKNNFLLSSSMDKLVKLWHPTKKHSLKTFPHPDFVTSVAFHPSDDRFFVSGCLDHKIRLWSIIEEKVSFEFDCKDLVTSVTFSPDDGKYVIVGTFNGYVFLLLTRGLEPKLSFHLTDTTTHKLSSKPILLAEYHKLHHGPRVIGVECFKSTEDNSLRALITSNDSKIRIFNLLTKELLEVFKGSHMEQTSHSAHLYNYYSNHPIVVCSSDSNWIYGWKVKSSQTLKQREEEQKMNRRKSLTRSGSFKNLFSTLSRTSSLTDEKKSTSYTSLSDMEKNSMKQERSHSFRLTSLIPSSTHSNPQTIKNSKYIAFRAHSSPLTTVTIAPRETSKVLSFSDDFICELSSEFFNLKKHEIDHRISNFARDSKNESTQESSPIPVSNVFNAVEAIGTIIVSTDNTGLIRVFRTDIPTKLRNEVLQKLEELKKDMGPTALSSSNSLSSSTRSSLQRTNSVHSTISNMIHAHSYTSLQHLHGQLATRNNPSTLYKQSKSMRLSDPNISPMKNSWSTKNNTTNRNSNTSSDSSSHKNDHRNTAGSNSQKSLHNKTTIGRSSRTYVNGTVPSLQNLKIIDKANHRNSSVIPRCEICNGTNFDPSSKGLVCRDCGTILNNFR